MASAVATKVLGVLTPRAGAIDSNSSSAPPQAGVLEGANPTEYTPSNPITLFIIQVSLKFMSMVLVPAPCRVIPGPHPQRRSTFPVTVLVLT